jgi:hypothetical protein
VSTESIIYHGIVRGKTIELDSATGLPDGQGVTVEIHATDGAGIRASAGAWADAGPELDEWQRQIELARRSGRSLPPS